MATSPPLSSASEGFTTAEPGLHPSPRWLLPALVVLAAFVAHDGCLGSTFYLDDWTQIVENDGVDGGCWWAQGTRTLTYLTYWLTYRIFGMSAPAFHAGNLLLHAGTALAVYGFAREFFAEAAGLPPDRARRVGVWAGVLFAVHPLCSEVPNYTRARDIELVSLFAVLTARAVLRWRRRGGWPFVAAAAAAILAAAFSKEVGVVVAGGTALFVGLGVRPPEDRLRWRWPGLRRSSTPTRLAVSLAGTLAVCVIIGLRTRINDFFLPLRSTLWQSLHDFRLPWHLLTQSRVFWMYAWRVVLPIRLCSDHQIAWTSSRADGVAWAAAAALTLVLAGTVCLWLRARTRPLALLLALVLLAVLHRLGNVSSELMVEYRVYPAMAFGCPALAWGLDWLRVRPAWFALLAAALAGGSVARTRDWRSPDTLAANVVAQYPLQARARQEVQEADVRAGRWDAVVARQDDIRRALDGIDAFNRSQTLRRYDPGLAVLTRVCSEGNCAEGLARGGQPGAAFEHLRWLRQAMRLNGIITPDYLAMYYYASGMVHDAVGQPGDALADLRKSREMAPYFNVSQRKLQQIEAREKR